MKVVTIFLFIISSLDIIGQCLPQTQNMIFLDNWDVDNLNGGVDRQFMDVWGYVDPSGNEYAIMGGSDSIYIFDVTNPELIKKVVSILQGDITSWRDFKTYGNYLYSISDGGTNTTYGVVIYDLSNLPNSVTRVKDLNAEFGKGHNIYIDVPNSRLYAVGMPSSAGDLCVYDLINPEDPLLLGCYDLDTIATSSNGNFYIHDIFVKDNIAYCSHGYAGYYIWDMNDPLNVSVLGELDNSFFDLGYVHSSWNSENDSFAIVATEVGSDPKMYWVDQRNPGLMKIKYEYKNPLCEDPNNLNKKTPHNPYVLGDNIYVSHYHDGVQVLEINNVEDTLRRVAYYDTYPENTDYSGSYLGNWGVYPYLPSGTILASDMRNGLFTLRHPFHGSYVFIGPGINYEDPENWEQKIVPPSGYNGKIQITSNCEVPISLIYNLSGRIEVKSGFNLTYK